jgi:carotenoid cleavage dioxygenase
MPRTDDRIQGKPYRYGYAITGRNEAGESAIGQVDVTTGVMTVWRPGPGSSVQEPQFVPRAPDSAENDGWVLTIVNRLNAGVSDLAVLDAKDIQAGPVALYRLPVRVRSTFHGMWVPAETMKRAAPKSFATAAS